MAKPDSHTDRDLVLRLRADSSFAFQLLLDRYSPKLYRFSRSYLKSSIDAEEIVQEVFLKVWKLRRDISPEKPFDAFLFAIARNAVLNTIRKVKSQRAYLHYCSMFPEKNILTHEEVNFHELEHACRLAIDRLSPKRREIYRLSRESFFSNAEIADHLGISVKTVENQMTSALAEIRKTLRSLGFSLLLFCKIFI
ncbi:MAG: RNA polymerase sigma-70 factor [Prolixibacteraceae bacterium]